MVIFSLPLDDSFSPSTWLSLPLLANSLTSRHSPADCLSFHLDESLSLWRCLSLHLNDPLSHTVEKSSCVDNFPCNSGRDISCSCSTSVAKGVSHVWWDFNTRAVGRLPYPGMIPHIKSLLSVILGQMTFVGLYREICLECYLRIRKNSEFRTLGEIQWDSTTKYLI